MIFEEERSEVAMYRGVGGILGVNEPKKTGARSSRECSAAKTRS
jgi:hypothetical protein